MKQLIKKIDLHLDRFLDQAEKKYNLGQIHPLLPKCIKDFSMRGGKRIRPLLILLSYQGYSNKKTIPTHILNAAISIELLHNFMLVHDDIIDSSDLRRGKATVHRMLEKIIKSNPSEKLGTDLAIITGDILYALAFESFLKVKEPVERKEKALQFFIETTITTAMGEFIDTLHGYLELKDVKEKDVFLNYTLKTARYTFECPLLIGAALAGANNQQLKKLSDFGRALGQAFQIQDDVIGIFDTEKNIGKSLLSDLEESKKTLLVAHAFENLKGKKKAEFLKIFTKQKKTLQDLKCIRKIFIEINSLSYCLDQISTRIKKSNTILKSLKINIKQKTILNEITAKLFVPQQRISEEYQIK